MEEKAKQIQAIVKELFDKKEIDLFIGYERASVPLKSRPCFITPGNPENSSTVENLVWDSFCSNNLAVFLPKYYEHDPRSRKKDDTPKPRIGVAAKGCDLRSIVALIKEKQIPRENVKLIGVPCTGMLDKRKIEDAAAGREILSCEEDGNGNVTVSIRGADPLTFGREDVLQAACLECRFPAPEGTDFTVEGASREPSDAYYRKIEEFEAKSAEERWEYFQQEISKCIRCNACRQACPTCYCKVCFAEQNDLKWIGVSTDQSDTMLFHLIRIFHQAGRCVECDACYRACPMGVDLRTFTKKIVKDVDELFDYVPDFNFEATPPLSTFLETDGESFITDPDKK